MLQIGNSWDTVLADEVKKPYFADLMQKVSKEYEKATVYPPKENIYNALRLTPYEKVKILAENDDRSLSSYINLLLREHIENKTKK